MEYYTKPHSPPIPAELTAYDHFITYRLIRRSDGKLDKLPTDPETRQNIDAQDPAEWMPYKTACERAAVAGLDGTGFVLSPKVPFTVVDLDGCRNPNTGQIELWARQLIERFGSYAEISPSGTGIHVWVYGMARKSVLSVEGHKVEVYSRKRFMTVTGQRVEDTPADIADGQDVLDELAGPEAPSTSAAMPAGENPFADDDDALIAEVERIFGDEFSRRFTGDTSLDGRDQSQTRAWLIRRLRWLTHDDAEQIERVMRSSDLDKSRWDEPRDGGRKTRLRWEIDNRFIAKGPLSSYYETTHDLDTRFDLFHPKDPHEINKRNGHDPDRAGFDLFHGRGVNGLNQNVLDDLFMSVDEFIDEAGDGPDWIAHGLLARGWVTDLVGSAKKSGKTTFTSYLIRRILDGRPFLDYETQSAKAVYLTEQGQSFAEALEKAGLNQRHAGMTLLPWKKVKGFTWSQIVGAAVQRAERVGANVLVVDTLNRFAGLQGEDENNAGAVAKAMNPLLAAAQAHNLAVLVIRHANKEGKGRGSTQFEHDVDILLELKRPDGNNADNVRVLEGIGRSDDVPDKLTIELTPEEYRNLGSGEKVKFRQACNAIRKVLPLGPDNPLPRKDLVDELRDEHGVAKSTANSALKRLEADGEIKCVHLEGRGNPVAYYRVPTEIVVTDAVPDDPDSMLDDGLGDTEAEPA